MFPLYRLLHYLVVRLAHVVRYQHLPTHNTQTIHSIIFQSKSSQYKKHDFLQHKPILILHSTFKEITPMVWTSTTLANITDVAPTRYPFLHIMTMATQLLPNTNHQHHVHSLIHPICSLDLQLYIFGTTLMPLKQTHTKTITTMYHSTHLHHQTIQP